MCSHKIRFFTMLLLFVYFAAASGYLITFGDTTPMVKPKELYSSKSLYYETQVLIYKIHDKYPDITEIENIGETFYGRDITALRIGKGKKEIFINGAHHAREILTTLLCLNQMEYLADAYVQNKIIGRYDVRKLLDEVSLYYVPLINPDGVEIARKTIDIPIPLVNAGKIKKEDWKANGLGVDLNRNYDADWKKLISSVVSASSRDYKGKSPFSEEETKAVQAFVAKHDFETVLCYHSAGELVFWSYGQKGKTLDRDYKLARQLGKLTGYRVEKPNEVKLHTNADMKDMGSMAGMKDWFVQKYNKPGFTLEIGKTEKNSTQLSFVQYNEIWNENKNVPLLLIDYFAQNVQPAAENKQEQEAQAQQTVSEILDIDAKPVYASAEEWVRIPGTRDQTADQAPASSELAVGKITGINGGQKNIVIYDKPEGKALLTLQPGEFVKLMAAVMDGWYKILLDDYKIGYIESSNVIIEDKYKNPLLRAKIYENISYDPKYLIIINQNSQKLDIYKETRVNKYDKIVSCVACTGGDQNPTPNGWFRTKDKVEQTDLFATQLKKDFYISGLSMNEKGQMRAAEAEAISRNKPDGNIKVPLKIAEFIYMNIPKNTMVIVDNTPPDPAEAVRWLTGSR